MNNRKIIFSRSACLQNVYEGFSFVGKYICDGNASSAGGDQYRYAAPPIRDTDVGSGSEC